MPSIIGVGFLFSFEETTEAKPFNRLYIGGPAMIAWSMELM